MKRPYDPLLRRDLLKVGFLTASIFTVVTTIALIPGFSAPTALALIAAILLSPGVAALERRGWSRLVAITMIFASLMALFIILGYFGIQSGMNEWGTFETKAPQYFKDSIAKLRLFESTLIAKYPMIAPSLSSAHPTDAMLAWGAQTGQWFAENGPGLMSSLLMWFLVTPPLTFIFLNEAPAIRKRFFQLVPNRYFELFFLVSSEIFAGISDYLRAKLLQATLMGVMTVLGLALIRAPYAIVLGILSGVTNIVPYIGPFLGAVPAIVISSFDGGNQAMIYSVAVVFIIANIIDTVVVFPIVVAKLVNLHPIILIVVVAIGQRFYGLIGMLISIPIATALKVILQEIYFAVYEHRSSGSSQGSSEFSPEPIHEEAA